MLRVKKIDEILQEITKPRLRPVPEIRLKPGDRLILCAGFEERALGVLMKAISAGCGSFSVIAVDYLPYVKQNRVDEIRAMCRSHNIPLEVVVYNRENPEGAGEKIAALLDLAKEHIHIDISGMSRLLIVQLLVALGKRINGFKNVHIAYSEAKKYPPSREEVENAIGDESYRANVEESIMFLSSGVFDVSIVPELSSTALQGQPIRLVAFPSFNQIQLTALRMLTQPSYFTIINGIPPMDEYKWRPEAIRKLNDIENLPHREEANVSTLDYTETLDYLLQVYKKYGAFQKIVLAPTGSKMQTVAVGILRAYLTDIQIAYPTPKMFKRPNEYTLGLRQMYSLPIESFPELE